MPPQNIRQLITKADGVLNSWHNDYQLVFRKLAHIYEFSNAIFLPTSKGFFMQLMWPIMAKDTNLYYLCQVSSVHVPVTANDPKVNHDFSKVEISKAYLGRTQRNFIEGSMYAVINKTSICHYSISATLFFYLGESLVVKYQDCLINLI